MFFSSVEEIDFNERGRFGKQRMFCYLGPITKQTRASKKCTSVFSDHRKYSLIHDLNLN